MWVSSLATSRKRSDHLTTIGRQISQGFFIGSWTLEGTTVIVRDLIDPSGQFAKYGFEMMLSLKSKPLGRYVASLFTTLIAMLFMLLYVRFFRWNKLELDEYSTVRLDNGEGEPLPLKHQKPFWFSKVRSYAPSLAVAELAELSALTLPSS